VSSFGFHHDGIQPEETYLRLVDGVPLLDDIDILTGCQKS